MQNNLSSCEALKEEGNKYLQVHELERAIESYTKAIELAAKGEVPDEKVAIYYANRAYCHIKMENYGLSLTDAN
jgi:tetratricopeptide (TPR) repeat protein